MQLRIISPQGQTTDRVVSAAVVRLGRDPVCEVPFDAAAYPKVSGEHARIEQTAAGLILTPRSQSNKTLLNDQPIAQPARLGRHQRREPENWQEAFCSSPLFIRYILDHMMVESEPENEVREGREQDERPAVNPIRQARILIHRYISIWRGGLQALLAMLGQSLLVAVLLGIVFGRLDAVENPLERAKLTLNLLFLLNVSCFWFGCNNASKELVKERMIFKRERDFNLRIDSYFVSKFTVLVWIVLIQVTLLFGIVQLWCGPPGAAVRQGAALAVLATAGTMLGLLISALAQTEEVAVALVPIAIIPQIILAGVIAPLKENGLGDWLAKSLITCRWAERAAEALLSDRDMELLYIVQVPYSSQIVMVAAHALVFAIMTLIALWRQGQPVKS